MDPEDLAVVLDIDVKVIFHPCVGSGTAALIERFRPHAEAERAHNFDRVVATMTDDCYQSHPSLGLRYERRDGSRRYYEELFGAFPDFFLEDDRTYASNANTLVIWGTLRAAMTGPWLGLPATRRTTDLMVVALIEFRGAAIVGETLLYDAATLCDQLGLDHQDLRARAAMTG